MGIEYLNNRIFEKTIQDFQVSKRKKAKYELIIEDLNGSQKRREKRNNKNKKRGKALEELLKQKQNEYQNVIGSFEILQDNLALAFYTLSENLVKYAQFQFIEEDDAIQEGVVICFEKIDRFNPEKGKAFNYMTTCILNHFRQLYRTARNYQELKKKYLVFLQQEIDRIIIHNGKQQSLSNNGNPIPVNNNRQQLD
jgi:hypothetical protein